MKKILILSLLGIAGITNAQVVYKYKDSSGKIIYSDSIPANKNEVLKQIVDKELTQEKEAKTKEQCKKDNSLLATYSSVNEITKLKNFELS